MEWGKRNGKPPPKAWADKPRLFEDLRPIWNAWHELAHGRQIGMAASGIPWSEMSRYCEDHGVHREQRLRWCRLIQAMDTAWLGEIHKKGDDADSRTDTRRKRRREGRETS